MDDLTALGLAGVTGCDWCCETCGADVCGIGDGDGNGSDFFPGGPLDPAHDWRPYPGPQQCGPGQYAVQPTLNDRGEWFRRARRLQPPPGYGGYGGPPAYGGYGGWECECDCYHASVGPDVFEDMGACVTFDDYVGDCCGGGSGCGSGDGSAATHWQLLLDGGNVVDGILRPNNIAEFCGTSSPGCLAEFNSMIGDCKDDEIGGWTCSNFMECACIWFDEGDPVFPECAGGGGSGGPPQSHPGIPEGMARGLDAWMVDQCTSCPPGTFKDDYGPQPCEPCPRGTVQEYDTRMATESMPLLSVEGMPRCVKCPPGTVATGPPDEGVAQVHAAGLISADQQLGGVGCEPCPEGTVAPAGSHDGDCSPCTVPGTFPSEDQGACLPDGYASPPDGANGWCDVDAVVPLMRPRGAYAVLSPITAIPDGGSQQVLCPDGWYGHATLRCTSGELAVEDSACSPVTGDGYAGGDGVCDEFSTACGARDLDDIMDYKDDEEEEEVCEDKHRTPKCKQVKDRGLCIRHRYGKNCRATCGICPDGKRKREKRAQGGYGEL